MIELQGERAHRLPVRLADLFDLRMELFIGCSNFLLCLWGERRGHTFSSIRENTLSDEMRLGACACVLIVFVFRDSFRACLRRRFSISQPLGAK